jgi:hypothetical protein
VTRQGYALIELLLFIAIGSATFPIAGAIDDHFGGSLRGLVFITFECVTTASLGLAFIIWLGRIRRRAVPDERRPDHGSDDRRG